MTYIDIHEFRGNLFEGVKKEEKRNKERKDKTWRKRRGEKRRNKEGGMARKFGYDVPTLEPWNGF